MGKLPSGYVATVMVQAAGGEEGGSKMSDAFDAAARDMAGSTALEPGKTTLPLGWPSSFSYTPMRLEFDDVTGLLKASPWTYHDSFGQDGIRFEIWFHWDGRARLEQYLPDGDRVPILLFRQGAADLFKAMETRRQARAGACTAAPNGTI